MIFFRIIIFIYNGLIKSLSEMWYFVFIFFITIVVLYHNKCVARWQMLRNKLSLDKNLLEIRFIELKKREIDFKERQIFLKKHEPIIRQKIEYFSKNNLIKDIDDYVEELREFLKYNLSYNGEDIMTTSSLIENNINLYFIIGIMGLLIGICLSLYVYIYIYKKHTLIYKILPKNRNIFYISVLLLSIYGSNINFFPTLNLILTQENLWQYISILYFAVVVTTIFLIIISNKFLTKGLNNFRKSNAVHLYWLTIILYTIPMYKIDINFYTLFFLLYMYNVLALYYIYIVIYNKNLFKYCLLIFIYILIIHFLIYLLFYCHAFNEIYMVEEFRLHDKQWNLINLKMEVLDKKIIEVSEQLNKLIKDTQNI